MSEDILSAPSTDLTSEKARAEAAEATKQDAATAATVGADGLLTATQRTATYGTLLSRPVAATAGDRALYFATDDNGGTLYQVQSAAWVRVGPKGTELAYAENTSDVTGISTAADVTGLTISFTVGDRPVMVEAVFPLVGQVTSTGQPTLFITNSSNTALASAQPPSMVATALFGGVIARVRLAAGSGAKTVKVRAATTAGTVTVFSNANRKTYIQAYEV